MNDVGRAYGEMADQYIGLYDGSEWIDRDDFDFVVPPLMAVSGTVIDVGCGPGHRTEHLRSKGVEAIGIDVVPRFIEHARTTFPHGSFGLGSLLNLPFRDGSVAGLMSWYSLIHLPPDQIDAALTELRRVLVTGGVLAVGFFDGEAIAPFGHAVATAYYWPAGELSNRLTASGFSETDRVRRPGIDEAGRRPSGAILAIAADG